MKPNKNTTKEISYEDQETLEAIDYREYVEGECGNSPDDLQMVLL